MREICPGCGAAITEEKCPYCGIMFYDFSAIDMNKPFFMKIKIGNKIHNLKVQVKDLSYAGGINRDALYADNVIVHEIVHQVPELIMTLGVLSENNILDIILDTDVTGECGVDIVSGVYK